MKLRMRFLEIATENGQDASGLFAGLAALIAGPIGDASPERTTAETEVSAIEPPPAMRLPKPKRKSPAKPGAKGGAATEPDEPSATGRRGSTEWRDLAAKYLHRHGPTKGADLERGIGASPSSLYKALKSDWFEQSASKEWQLSAAGKVAAKLRAEMPA